jgi:hypothetical protein
MRREEESDVPLWAALLGLVMVLPLGLWNGFFLSIMWGWFLVPLGVPSIGVAHAWGLAMLLSLLTFKLKQDNSTLHELLAGIIYGIIFPPIALFFGWIALMIMA